MTQLQFDTDELIFEEKIITFSTWKNNGTDTATFRLMLHEKRPGKDRPGWHNDGSKCQGSLFRKIVLKPGESIELPSEFDNAIRKVSPKTGQVESGLCPWLTKIGEEDVIVPDVFDYHLAREEEEAGKILKKIRKETDMRAAKKVLDEEVKRKREEVQHKKDELEYKRLLAEEAALKASNKE